MTQESSQQQIDAHDPLRRSNAPRRFSVRSALSICLGVVVTLCVYGYQFGRGNHAVYLLDAIREAHPPALQNDWFTTQTFQYHVVFTQLTQLLMRLRIVEPAFATGYLLLIILFHIAWRGIIRQIGGEDVSYLLSVALYHLSAAGTGLGMYQFFQDSSLLPSNIANIAMLCAIWMWLARRFDWAGAWFGIAGIFHLNHALIGIGLWIVLLVSPRQLLRSRALIVGTVAALLPSMINIALAARLKLARSGTLPLDQFVDLYVRLRHPHHYDPSTWPIGIWLAFGWTALAAVVLLRSDARRIVLVLLGLILVALVGAGIWYWSETLVQMSLYRFSIYVQLLGCCAAAIWIRSMTRKRELATLSPIACAAIAMVCAVRGPFFGVFQMPRDDADYVAMCRWVATETPIDALFLVPPDEESMRLVGRRAIVVNYKAVPQLSAELVQWRQRMCDVLAMDDLTQLPHGYSHTLPAIRERYDQLTADQLAAIAQKYQARYVIASHSLPTLGAMQIHAAGRYMLYDLQPLGKEQRQ
jgi:hypothetical protein